MAVYCANMPNFGRMRDGLRIIYGSAFENNEFLRFVTIPETVDSIGSRAFVVTVMPYPAGAGPLPVFRCNATVPPKMGLERSIQMNTSFAILSTCPMRVLSFIVRQMVGKTL